MQPFENDNQTQQTPHYKTRWGKQGTTRVPVGQAQPQMDATVQHTHAEQARIFAEDARKREVAQTRMVKAKEHLIIPTMNRLYDSLLSPHGWKYCTDAYVTGQVTTVANTAVVVKAVLTKNSQWLTSKWPGGVQLYPVIHFFSVAPESVPTTVGNVSVVFTDNSGITVPLGVFVSSQAYSNGAVILIPSPITDPGATALGTLTFTLNGTTPTTAVYDWQIGVSAAYLLPAQKGYEIREYDHWKEEYQLYEKPHRPGDE